MGRRGEGAVAHSSLFCCLHSKTASLGHFNDIKVMFFFAMDSVLALSAYELVIGEGFLFFFFTFPFGDLPFLLISISSLK